MAKRGCGRASAILTVVVLLLLVIPSNSELSFFRNATASITWIQNSLDDFASGTLSNVEISEYEEEAFLQLNRTGEWSNVTPGNSPPPRYGHSIVFDESVNATVLFGGRNETVYFADTWLYFSGNNTWVEFTPPGSPNPREGHAMAYDSENELMVMYGGYDGTNYLSETWTYSAGGNIWMSLNPASPPSARAWTAMSYDREEDYIILFGGQEKFQIAGDTWKYDLSSNLWTSTVPFNSPRERYGHSMIYDESLALHIMTGGFVRGHVWSDTWTYNSTSVIWVNKPLGNTPLPRANHSIVYDSIEETTYMFGGYGNSTENDGNDRLVPLPCQIPASDLATTVVEHNRYLYIGTSNISNQAKIYRYDLDTETCIEWTDAGVFYVYSSASYGGVVFWGSREGLISTLGPLLYYDGVTFGSIPATTWFSSIPISGWVQDFELFDGKLFAAGSTMMGVPENDNNFFVKYCDNPPCKSGSDWHWTDTSPNRVGYIDDGLSLEEFNGELYLATYDWCSVLKYYPTNNTWWYVLNGSVDGDSDGKKGGYGIFGLANYSNELHALTYISGWHWTTSNGVSWNGVNESLGSFTRAIVFENRLYAGLVGPSSDSILSLYGSTWSYVGSGTDTYLYFAESQGKLYISSGNKVFRREAYHNDLWEYDDEIEYWEQLADIDPPTDRSGFSLAFDTQNGVIVLFGGVDETYVYGDTFIYDKTVGSGVFTSATLDSGNTNLQTRWQHISWSRTSQPSGAFVNLQLASNNDNATWMYRGPDGTAGSYYNNPLGQDVWSGHDGNRYLRFRAYFGTSSSIGPILDKVTIRYGHAPAQPILSSPSDDVWTHDNSPRFTWAFDDFDPGDSQTGFQVLIGEDAAFSNVAFDSGAQDSLNEYWQLPSTLSDGVWFWKVRTKDSDGMWGDYSEAFTLKIDTEGPTSRTSNLTSDSYTDSILFINGTSNDTHSGVESCELLIVDQASGDYWDGSIWQGIQQWLPSTGTTQWSFDATSVNWVSEREYSITSRSTDIAGNVEVPTQSTNFFYDTTEPSVTMLNPTGAESPEGGKNIEIQWTAEDAYINQSSIGISYSTDGGTNWNLIADNELNDGSYNWTLPRMKSDMRIMVEAGDLAGNIGSDMSGVFYVRAPEKEEDWLTEYWWVILIIILIIVGLLAYYWWKRTSTPEEEEAGPPPIVATAGETTLCAVCLGTVKEGLSVIKCGECGKTFHEKCAARIEKCPNCESKLDMSELEEE